MIIGVPKEIKSNENRVALTPAGALELSKEDIKFMYSQQLEWEVALVILIIPQQELLSLAQLKKYTPLLK